MSYKCKYLRRNDLLCIYPIKFPTIAMKKKKINISPTIENHAYFVLAYKINIFCFYEGRLHGIFEKFAAYQRWIDTSARAKLFERMLNVCGMINDPECPTAGKRRDLNAA